MIYHEGYGYIKLGADETQQAQSSCVVLKNDILEV